MHFYLLLRQITGFKNGMLVTKKKGSKGMLVTKKNIKTPLLEWKEESSEKQKGEKITCILTL